MLEWKNQVPIMVGMFQKEVAQRIAAQPGSKAYGILSVLTQAHYEAAYLFDVPPEAFNPPPQVMSGVIILKRKTTELSYASEKKFITLVKTAFGQRRKMLRNPLKPLFHTDVLQQDIFSKRPEQLSLDDFANLTHLMK
jgi:16S rRNA (adenine1518-N6/adenine1519-N6)-dimethyltransferase